tara:strand:+ start:476 stop:694 length:219 start_codon:yes stop_codon:yes gene_type:complete
MRSIKKGASAQNLNEDLVPVRSEDLIARLDEAYPARCKSLNESEEEHQRYAGIRTLIDELIGLLEEQNQATD